MTIKSAIEARAAVLGDLTTCHMYLGELDRAVEEARQIVAIAPGYSRGLQRCLATFGAAGRSDLAEPVLELLLKAQPDFSENYVRETYPFHPSFKHLVALFKENEGFRQTRGLMQFTARLLKSVSQRENDDVFLTG